MADAPAPTGPAAGGGSPADQAKGLLDNPIAVLILGFFTCMIVPLWWMWTRVKELNAALGKQQVNPMFVVPGCICFPVMWYASWLYAQGFHEFKKQKLGAAAKDEIMLHAILLILIMPVGQYMIQTQLNEINGKKV